MPEQTKRFDFFDPKRIAEIFRDSKILLTLKTDVHASKETGALASRARMRGTKLRSALIGGLFLS